MRKRRRAPRPRASYSEQQIAGLRAHTQIQKQSTVDRLATTIASLTAQKKPISAKTIREECGLEYASIRRNPEALLLYQQHSTFLQHKRKRMKTSPQNAPVSRDPLLAYKKTQLAARLREERARREALERQHAELLQDYVQRDIKIAELEAELAQYRGYLERLRLHVQQQEHRG